MMAQRTGAAVREGGTPDLNMMVDCLLNQFESATSCKSTRLETEGRGVEKEPRLTRRAQVQDAQEDPKRAGWTPPGAQALRCATWIHSPASPALSHPTVCTTPKDKPVQQMSGADFRMSCSSVPKRTPGVQSSLLASPPRRVPLTLSRLRLLLQMSSAPSSSKLQRPELERQEPHGCVCARFATVCSLKEAVSPPNFFFLISLTVV